MASDLKKWATAKTNAIGEKLYVELAEDYPPEARSWVRSVPWKGPTNVPLSDIDFSDRESWTATKEPSRVESFQMKIRNGWRKPIILIQKPNAKTVTVVDGHHRALAYQREGLSVPAYVANTPTSNGPWDGMHRRQYDESVSNA